jgi:hypothetical protein
MLFISNYPRSRSPQDVARALSDLCPVGLKLTDAQAAADGCSVVTGTDADHTLLHSMCGRFAFQSRVWITKFPAAPLGGLSGCLSLVFEAHTWHGQVDLSHLRDKVAQAGGSAGVVDFGNLDFAEFLWLRLGTESRDSCFMVHTLLLGGNGIEDVSGWAPFVAFLPHLHFLSLTDNPLKFAPKFIASSWLQVEVTQTHLPMPKPPELPTGPFPWFGLKGAAGGAGADWGVVAGEERGDERAPDVQTKVHVRDLTRSELEDWSDLIGAAEVMGDIPAGFELPPPFFG